MQKNFKAKLTTTISSLTMMGMLAAPFAAFAETGTSVKVKTDTNANFCTVINSEDFKAMVKFEDGLAKREDHRDERDGKIEDRRGMFDQKREYHRSEFENKQEDRSMKLEGKNLTDEQKEALSKAQIAVQSALNLKTTDMAELVSEFRASMDGIRSEHRLEIDGALVDVKAEIDAAIAKAKADCAAGVPSETVKANFQASMKTTHEKFAEDRKAIQAETRADVKAEVDARKVDGLTIRSSFRASVKTAWESFKSLFNKN